jgi:hypothetical protein
VTVHVARAAISGEPRATVVGNNVTVAHGATLHACTVGDGCLVGMGATLLDGVVMEPGSIVAAGAVVPPGGGDQGEGEGEGTCAGLFGADGAQSQGELPRLHACLTQWLQPWSGHPLLQEAMPAAPRPAAHGCSLGCPL